MPEYGQFCPISKAAALLDQRWTLLVVRELLLGSHQFNEIRRGVPRMSPTLLSRRLRELDRAGVISRRPDGRYLLTDAGEELRPVVMALGTWGTRWLELTENDLDPKVLMWDMRRGVDLTGLPTGRTVIHFRFLDVAPAQRHWWMVLTRDGVDVCDYDPGYDVIGTIETDLRTATQVWRGDQSWDAAQRSGRLTIVGPRSLRRTIPGWLGQSAFASVDRPA
jgi:DNA-binding HxlR family transcriptional regulator